MNKIAIAFFSFLGVFNSAYASYINVGITGSFDYIDPNVSITTDTVISGSVNFDDSSITGVGYEQVYLSYDENATLFLTVGNVSFTKYNDYGYGMGIPGYPVVNYHKGVFSGIEFYLFGFSENTATGCNVDLRIFNGNVDLLDCGSVDAGHGSIQYSGIATTPIPSALWLLASGGIGLIGFSKRKMRKTRIYSYIN